MRRRLLACLLLLPWLAGCAVARFDVPGASDEAAYAAQHPTYAEFCALSQIKKIRGFGADIRGEIGGHSIFYLNGACRRADVLYPVLEPCDGGGVGLSMNAHFANAKWVAVPGRSFFFDGGVPAGSRVTRAAYLAVRAEAERLRLYDGIRFHRVVFDDKPAGWSDRDWKYEMSIGTDYAIGLARGHDCARVPVTRAQMAVMIQFLNDQNAPYRAGRKVFDWSVFNDNCIHLAHNALAAAGLWRVWPIDRFLPIAIFDFPVPKNEFVNLMRRTDDGWLRDPGAVYYDVPARRELLEYGRLPSMPGGLAEAAPPHRPNDVYETTGLRLIFYDDPITGHYAPHFNEIFREPRYTDAAANTAYFAGLARRALAERRPVGWWLDRAPYRGDPAGFTRVYDAFYGLMDRLARA